MSQRKQSTTTYPITFLLVSSADHVTAVTGATPTVTLSKSGAGFGAAAGAVSEIGNGWYALAGNATDRNTLGELAIHATATGADAWDGKVDIVPYDPFEGVALAATQGAVTFGQVKIAANVADEGALDIVNSNSAGHGQRNVGGFVGNASGQMNYGSLGQLNRGKLIGQENNSALDGGVGDFAGQYNCGAVGQYNEGSGANSEGQHNVGWAAGIFISGSGGAYGDLYLEYGTVDPMWAVGGDQMALVNGAVTAAAVATGAIDADAIAADAVAEIQSGLATPADVLAQATAALVAQDLDHLIQVSAGAEEPTDGSYLDQIMHKDASQTFDASTDSLEAISDKLTSAQITVTSPVAGTTLTVVRGDTLTASFSGLGNISTRTKLWLTIKGDKTEADTAAAIQVLVTNPAAGTDGLQRLNGAATTAAYGSLTVTDAAAGNVTLVLAPAATSVLRETARYYDIQVLKADGSITTLTTGDCDVNLDVTAAIA